MASAFDRERLEQRLLVELSQVRDASAPDLSRLLGVSQPVFSRLVKRLGPRLLIVGRARATRYAARRTMPELGDRLPVYEIDEHARATQIATLHALSPDGFYVESLTPDVQSTFYTDLPYWLNELRPAGFLGRLVPKQHPELELPPDVRLWTADQTLRYIASFGWNLSGSLIVGDAAFQRYVSLAHQPPDLVQTRQRRERYPTLASDALKAGTIGSSAGGEQPKFLVTRTPGARPALVKFSPSTKTGVGRRSADLLVAEHLALEVLAKHGKPAAKSELVAAGEQIFLEVERFDRTPQGGRRGLISLLALDAEFVGRMVSWTDSVSRLVDNQILPRAMIRNVAWLELFGRLIANSDMHAGNLSFFARGSRVLGIAPAYDMLPAQYAGQQGHLAEVTFEPAPPKPADSDVWNEASGAALELWQRVLKHELVSADFRGIARHNAKVVEAFRDAGRLLPAPR